LRGTFAKAYALLTLLVSKIGWDDLLKTRSVVFVMEEEYRLHKTTQSVDVNGHDDNASVAAVRSPSRASERLPTTPADIPTIRISSESTRVPPKGANGANGTSHQATDSKSSARSYDATGDLEKPETAQANEEPGTPINQQGEEFVSAFSNKRLCERWLDNLFLYVPRAIGSVADPAGCCMKT